MILYFINKNYIPVYIILQFLNFIHYIGVLFLKPSGIFGLLCITCCEFINVVDEICSFKDAPILSTKPVYSYSGCCLHMRCGWCSVGPRLRVFSPRAPRAVPPAYAKLTAPPTPANRILFALFSFCSFFHSSAASGSFASFFNRFLVQPCPTARKLVLARPGLARLLH